MVDRPVFLTLTDKGERKLESMSQKPLIGVTAITQYGILLRAFGGHSVNYMNRLKLIGAEAVTPSQYKRVLSNLIAEGYAEEDVRTPEEMVEGIRDRYGTLRIRAEGSGDRLSVKDLASSLATYARAARNEPVSSMELNDAIRKASPFLSRALKHRWGEEFEDRYRRTLTGHSRAEKVLLLDKIVSTLHSVYGIDRRDEEIPLFYQDVCRLLNRLREG